MASETRQGRPSRSPVGVWKLLLLALAGLLLWRADSTGFVSGDVDTAGAVCYSLTLNVGGGSGSVLAMPDSSGSCPSGQYTAGYNVAVVATPGGGYIWSGWSGTDDNNANPTGVTMTGDRTATAFFTWNCYQLTLNVGGGTGTVQAFPDSAGGCPTGQYPPGYSVAVVATPGSGYQFSSWSGTDNNNNSSTSVTMAGDRTATAYFTSTCYSLTLNVGGGSGSVLAFPTSSGGCPTGQYTAGYVVAIVATPNSGYQFSSWSGTDNNNNSSTTVTMTGNRTATAYFTSTCYQLTLNVGGGNGSVLAMPTSSGGCPTGRYTAGYVVAVLASPNSGYQFSSWTGTDNNNNSSTTVTMTGDRTATAYFTSNCFQLTLNVGGGSGSVLAMPTSAGGCPTGQYTAGYVVAVVAIPNSGSQFSSWTGTDNNNNNSSTTVTMNGNRTATAYFGSNCYHLTLNVGGGNGSVLAMPTSAGGCSNGHYPQGYAVAVLATPGSGYLFSSWSGTDNNGNSSTTVTMNGDRTATAYFVAQGGTAPPTNTSTSTPTYTPTWTPTHTSTPTPTSTSTSPPTATSPSAPTNTPTPTWSPTPTSTPVPGAPTDTPAPPATPTDAPPAGTPTGTLEATATAAPSATSTPTPTHTSPPTATATATRTRTFTPSPTRTFTPSPTPQGLRGDADCSGYVTAIDAALVLQAGAGLIAHAACPQEADANADGLVNAIDAALILQFGAGLLAGL